MDARKIIKGVATGVYIAASFAAGFAIEAAMHKVCGVSGKGKIAKTVTKLGIAAISMCVGDMVGEAIGDEILTVGEKMIDAVETAKATQSTCESDNDCLSEENDEAHEPIKSIPVGDYVAEVFTNFKDEVNGDEVIFSMIAPSKNIFDSFVNESENQPITKSMVLSWQTWAMKNDIPYFFKNVADMHDLYLVCQPRINQLTICMSKAGPNEWVRHLNEKEIKGGQSNESN